MLRLVYCALAALFICSPSFAKSPTEANPIAIIWNDSLEEAKLEAIAQNKPILALFTGSTWCPACIWLEQNYLSNQDFIDQTSEKFVWLKVDFPRNDQRSEFLNKMMQDYKIRFLPTLLILNSDGQELEKISIKHDVDAKAFAQMLIEKSHKISMASP